MSELSDSTLCVLQWLRAQKSKLVRKVKHELMILTVTLDVSICLPCKALLCFINPGDARSTKHIAFAVQAVIHILQ